MTALPETQALVLDALLGRSDGAAALRLLRPARGVPAARRLQIYRNNLFESLTAALEAVYPVVARLVGEAFFRGLARQYIGEHPSRSGNLHAFGRELPRFIERQPVAERLPYLAGVAALEWACHEVWHEADDILLDPATLAAVPAGVQLRLRLHLQAATRLVASPYPVLRIWQANQSDADDASISLDEGGVRLLVARDGLEIEFRRLDAAEDHWLRTLADGNTLGAATAAALAVDVGFDLGATLSRHLRLGSFARWSLAGRAPGRPKPARIPSGDRRTYSFDEGQT